MTQINAVIHLKDGKSDGYERLSSIILFIGIDIFMCCYTFYLLCF